MVNPTAMMMPMRVVRADFLVTVISPNAVPSPNARFGAINRAMTIAPITTVTLFSIRPIAATAVDSRTRTI
jgi:hypothetical protein